MFKLCIFKVYKKTWYALYPALWFKLDKGLYVIKNVVHSLELHPGLTPIHIRLEIPLTIKKQVGVSKLNSKNSRLEAFAGSCADPEILARDSKYPNLTLLFKKRRQLFKKLLLQEKRENISNEVKSFRCAQKSVLSMARRETREAPPRALVSSLKCDGLLGQEPLEVVNLYNNLFAQTYPHLLLLIQHLRLSQSLITHQHTP